jgi:hypothetical protein
MLETMVFANPRQAKIDLDKAQHPLNDKKPPLGAWRLPGDTGGQKGCWRKHSGALLGTV